MLMDWAKSFFKEAGLYVAFILVGTLLLLSFWISTNLQDSILSEFRYKTMTLIFAEDPSVEFRKLVESHPSVVRYEIQGAYANKDQIRRQYPELATVVENLDEQYFPSSALVTLRNLSGFQTALKSIPDRVEKSIVHQPPLKIATFFNMLLGLFGFLWLLILALLIYFKLERLAVKESARWSLMKMLGARASQIFLPLCWIQILQISFGGFAVLLLATFSMGYLRGLFEWNWENLSPMIQVEFLIGTLVVGIGLFFLIFSARYRKTALG